jgi:hypothetical protein
METNPNVNCNAKEYSNQKMFEIKRSGRERKINFFVVVELFRFLFYLWFISILVLSVITTVAFVEVDYKKIVKSFGGSINVCVYFDFPPFIYVMPALYSVFIIIAFLFIVASIFRAWISKEENKITANEFNFYLFAFCYFFLATIMVSITMAIQPNLEKPETWIIHTLPFTNLVVALMLLHIAMTWFNLKVAWVELNGKRWLKITNCISLIIIVTTSVIKIVYHINSFGGLKQGENREVISNGWMWEVKNETIGTFFRVVDSIWMIFVLIFPMCQSGYLAWKKFDTHGIIVTIEDNRIAKIT